MSLDLNTIMQVKFCYDLFAVGVEVRSVKESLHVKLVLKCSTVDAMEKIAKDNERC